MARTVTVFVASPGDVATERQHVAGVAAAINRSTAGERDVQFRVLDWKTDARPRRPVARVPTDIIGEI